MGAGTGLALAITARPRSRGRSLSLHVRTSPESMSSSAASGRARLGPRCAGGKTPDSNCMKGICLRPGKQCTNCEYAGSSKSITGGVCHASISNKCALTSNVGPKPFFAKAGAHECRCITPLMACSRASMTCSLVRSSFTPVSMSWCRRVRRNILNRAKTCVSRGCSRLVIRAGMITGQIS